MGDITGEGLTPEEIAEIVKKKRAEKEVAPKAEAQGAVGSSVIPAGEGYDPGTSAGMTVDWGGFGGGQAGVGFASPLTYQEGGVTRTPRTEGSFDLGTYAQGQGFAPYSPTGAPMPGGSAADWASFVEQEYGLSAQDFVGMSSQEQYEAYAQQNDIALNPEDVPVGPDGLPTRPPKTPQEAALFQFVSEQATRAKNEQLLQQAIEQMQLGMQAQQAEAGRAREEGLGFLQEGLTAQQAEATRARTEATGALQTGMEAQQAEDIRARTEATGFVQQGMEAQQAEAERARTEATGVLREGMARQEAEVSQVRAENRGLMQQSMGVMQYALGLLRRGGQGSLAQFAQPGYGQMAQTLMAGRETPYDFGQGYSQMAGVAGQQANLMPGYGAMADIAGQRTDVMGGYQALAGVFGQQANLMPAYGAMAEVAGQQVDYGRFYAGMADIYNQSQYMSPDFSYYLTPYAYGVGVGGA